MARKISRGNYNWKYDVIAIIAIVIVIAVFIYFIFISFILSNNTGLGPGYVCAAASGYECISPVLSHTTGLFSFTFGQATGLTQFNASLICATTKDKSGLPYVANGSPNATHIGNMKSGQSVNVNMQCYDSSGNLIHNSTPLGEKFYNLYIWETYYNKNGSNSTTLVVVTIPELTAT